jgi:hypothetical protein
MVRDFGLRGSALIAYAVIYAFSQDGESWFSGSVGYISEWAGTDERTIRNGLEFLLEAELIVVEKRPGYTSRYRVNLERLPDDLKRSGVTPEKRSGDPGKNFRGPRKKLPDTPEKTSDDIDLGIDLEIKTQKNQGDFVFGRIPARTKEEAATVFNLARAFSNNHEIFPECRDQLIPPDRQDILTTLLNYSWEDIQNALENFHWHNTGNCGPGWKPPPPFRSLYGFLKTGVAQYCKDGDAKALFREQKHGAER